MPRIEFPNVPNVAGVPALVRSPTLPAPVSAVLGVLQGTLWRSLYVSNRWGIFLKGKNILEIDSANSTFGRIFNTLAAGPQVSTTSVTYSKEFRVSDFPLEGGKFASYNKVELPAQPIVMLSMSGTETERAAFLDKIDKLAKSLDAVDVVVPERNYISHVIESYNYTRSAAKGAYMLNVELRLREVRSVTATFVQSTSNAKSPNAKPAVANGKVQGAQNTQVKKVIESKPR